jgi:hypothetical protein
MSSANKSIDAYVAATFGCNSAQFVEALQNSPNSRGYILGALSEMALRHYLETRAYEVVRIVEKPSGGNDAKSDEARGDFYVRKRGQKNDAWLVVESKGLKSNSEFRGAKLDSPEKVHHYLRALAFPPRDCKQKIYDKGLQTYTRAKEKWERKHPGKRFPPFRWNRSTPGPVTCDLSGIWRNPSDLECYIAGLEAVAFTEDSYRNRRGALAVLETHKPSRRLAPLTKINHAAPLVSDFSILAVDLYLRTGRHEFAFVNPKTISHSPTSPEHLYQNYTIDVLVPGLKVRPRFVPPWYEDFADCVGRTSPEYRTLDRNQVDHRMD